MYRPNQFTESTPPPRIIGVEMENRIGGPNRTGTINRLHLVMLGLLPDWTIPSGSDDYFLLNGARVYEDIVGIDEYATPECLGPRQAALADMAGQQIIIRLAGMRKGVFDASQRVVLRRTGYPSAQDTTVLKPIGNDHKCVTYGYHENYIIPAGLVKSGGQSAALLASFLATRPVWGGAGAVGRNGYILSQKAPGIGVTVGSPINKTSPGNKPMFMIKTLDDCNKDILAANDGWNIIETRCADATHSPYVRYLGLAATSLVLRMMEQDCIDSELAESLILKDPVGTLHSVGMGDGLHAKCETLSGEVIDPVEHQRRFAAIAQSMSKSTHLPEDERYAIGMWLETVERLERVRDGLADAAVLRGTLEWAARLYRLNRLLAGGAMTLGNHSAVDLDIRWDIVSAIPRTGAEAISTRWWRAQKMPEGMSWDLAKTLETEPPAGTRAHDRVAILKRPLPERVRNVVMWNEVRRTTGSIERLDNPYSTAA